MADNKLTMKIALPTGIEFNGEVLHAAFPGVSGEFAVFPGHAPLISALGPGTVRYTLPGGNENTFIIKGGFAEVDNNRIVVCAEQ